MSTKLGQEAKLYLCAAGIGDTPTWMELKQVKNVNLGLQKGEADVSTRANGGWKASKGALKEATIEFEMPWDTEADGFEELRASYLTGSAVGLAVMDGDITTAGSEGLWADCEVLDFSRDEPLEDAMSVKVTAKPTSSTNPPQWKTIAAQG